MNLKKDEENNKHDSELTEMIHNAVTEKYGADESIRIVNEQYDTQCMREHPFNIATFKMAIQIGFMFAKILNEPENG